MDLSGRALYWRGASPHTARRFSAAGRKRIVLAASDGASLPWAELRRLLGALYTWRGDAAVAAAMAPHRGPLSLALRGLVEGLSGDERLARDRASAQVHGFLSHNSLMRWPLTRAWQDTLAPLCAEVDIVVPDLGAADPHSLAVLISLLRLQPTARLVFAWNPDSLPEDPVLRWDALLGHSAGDRLSLLDGAEALGPCTGDEAPAATALHPADEPDELDADAPSARVLRTMEAAFACFGFTSCQRLGMALVQRPGLSPADSRRVNLLTALSAYNRQVGTRGERPEDDEALAALLDRSFRAALDGEPDPALRSHLLYRLCINAGRRKSELDLAADLAERSVAEGLGHPMEEAWARNGLAYVLGRQRRTDDAIAECARAEALLRDPLPGIAEVERPLTRAVLFDNLIELCALAGRWPEALGWHTRHELERPEALPPSGRSLKALRHALRPADLRALAERGLLMAEERLDPIESDWMAAHAADAAYRQLDATAAVSLYRKALASARRLAGELDVRATETSLAMALLRAGEAREAAEALTGLRDHTTEAAARVELSAVLGWALALAGDAAASQAAINGAIAGAVGLGQRDVLVRVACAAGEACLALGLERDALQAFRQALEMTGVGEGSPASDRLWALCGVLATGGIDPQQLDDALDLLPEALPDPEAWWELPRLLELSGWLNRSVHPRLAVWLDQTIMGGR